MIGDEFERAFDEVFEDLLIRRWRRPERVRDYGKALIVEDDENYRIKIAMPNIDPRQIEIEAGAWRLVVRVPTARGRGENALDFSHRIDTERVTARFEAGMLEVLAPKARGRKIEIS